MARGGESELVRTEMPNSPGQGVEIRIFREDRGEIGDGDRLYLVSCTRVVRRPDGTLEVGFGYTNESKIIPLTGIEIG